jgi:oligopeptide transport system substrate-binding protein
MKKYLSGLTALALVAAAALIFAGCSKKAAAPASTTAAAPAQTTSGTPMINVSFGSEPQTIDPALNSAVDGAIYIHHFFEGLYTYKDNGKVAADQMDGAVATPGLAAAPPTKVKNADGTVTLTYKLRPNLKWSDGSPLTAKDFVYSWQRLVNPTTAASYAYQIDQVVNAEKIRLTDPSKVNQQLLDTLGIKALDDSTLQITLKTDCAYWADIAAFPATFPVQKATIDKNSDQWTFDPKTYVCDGPYMMKEWKHNSYILAEKNPYYWDAAHVDGPQEIKFSLMDNDNATLAAFKSGELDMIENVPADETPSLLADKTLHVAPYLGTYYISFNNKVKPFDDPKVREAFTLAVDRNYLVQQVTRTGEKPASGFVPSGEPDAAPGSDFRQVGGDYFSIKPEDYAANCKKAQQLLADAGYPGGKGFPVVEYLYNTNDKHRAIAEALQNMWKNVLGINVNITNQDWAVFLATRKAQTYSGMARDGWIADYNDPINFLDMFTTGNGNNDTGYANPYYDKIINEVGQTADEAQRMKLMHQAEDMILGKDWSMGPLYFYTQPYMINPKLQGVYYTSLGFFFFKHAKVVQ